jgi:7-keto-8-aminopelargonate synthetase-like enzyme
VREALAVMEEEPALRERLWANTRRMLDALQALGFDTGASSTPIVPITVGSVERTFHAWKALSEAGVFVNVVLPPAVPTGGCLIRMTLTAEHTAEQIDEVVSVLERVGVELGIISPARQRLHEVG